MEEWVLWMVGAGALAVGEMLTLSFFLGPVAVAAVLAAIAALVGLGPALQLLVFVVASAASLLVFRPIAQRHLKTPTRLRSGTAALVGCDALVVEQVDGRSGQVKLSGELWTARTYDEDDVIEPGARVRVMQIDGATALVSNGLE